MKKRWHLALLIAPLGACSGLDANTLPAAETVYQNGKVWTGDGFETRDIAISDGKIVEGFEMDATTRVIDVTGQYITPALANAHQHITSPTAAADWSFFKTGVFYVWNPNMHYAAWPDEANAYYARPDTVDVKTSFGGVTEPGSHPEPLYVDNLAKYVYNNATYDDMYQSAFHYGRSPQEIEDALDLLVDQGAAFVKIYLLDSARYSLPAPDGSATGTTGLNPENIEGVVEAAHIRDLPVYAHIETRDDFLVAVKAGVDIIGHMPGYNGVSLGKADKVTLQDGDAELAAARGTYVIPTYALVPANINYELDQNPSAEREAELEERLTRSIAVHAQNLKRLQAAGVPILAGTDLFPGKLLDEPRHWVNTGAMTELEALQAMLKTGPLLFPKRRIGCLEAGCEADFLVLAENPVLDLTAFETITYRIKSGVEIIAPTEAD